MVQSFHSTAIRFPFCMNKPQSLFVSLKDFTACGIPFLLLRSVQITTRVFKQSRTRNKKKNKKKSVYTCKIFLSICLSDLVPLEHPFCSPVFAGIYLNFMQTPTLLLLHVNSKFCQLCLKYYLIESQSLIILS